MGGGRDRRERPGAARPRRAAGPRTLACGGIGLLLLGAIGCGASGPDPIAVPSFSAPRGSAPGGSGGAGDGPIVGLAPPDCVGILAPADLGALLGLPLESVDVRTVLGVPEPSVGRIERMSCRYTGRGRDAGRTLLAVQLAAYTDPSAAAKQWQVNVDAESGEHRTAPLGSAPAVLVHRRDEFLLTVVHRANVLTLIRSGGGLPEGRAVEDLLVDVALRMLPAAAGEPVVPGPQAPAPVEGSVAPSGAPTAATEPAPDPAAAAGVNARTAGSVGAVGPR